MILFENGNIRQGEQLIDIDWKLDMEVASERGKKNTPIVSIELNTA
jgi:hypothetical protein